MHLGLGIWPALFSLGMMLAYSIVMGLVYGMMDPESDLTAVRNAICRRAAYLPNVRRFAASPVNCRPWDRKIPGPLPNGVGLRIGLSDPSHFIRQCRKHLGMTPGKLRGQRESWSVDLLSRSQVRIAAR